MGPVLLNVYTDGLGKSLVYAGLGCKIGGTMANCFFYEDDICLLSPSVFALQELLLTASVYALEHNISFNVEKTVCMKFGVKSDVDFGNPKIILNGRELR